MQWESSVLWDERELHQIYIIGKSQPLRELAHSEVLAPLRKALGKARPAPDRSSCAPPADPPGALPAGPFHLQLRTSLSVASA